MSQFEYKLLLKRQHLRTLLNLVKSQDPVYLPLVKTINERTNTLNYLLTVINNNKYLKKAI